jgi:large subunit ribosomal protein L35
MPKHKTRKSITKRFKVTKTGKVMRGKGFSGHLRVKKSSKKKRSQRKMVEADKYHSKKIKKYLGL